MKAAAGQGRRYDLLSKCYLCTINLLSSANMAVIVLLSNGDILLSYIRKNVVPKSLADQYLSPVFGQSKFQSRCYQTFRPICCKYRDRNAFRENRDVNHCYQTRPVAWIFGGRGSSGGMPALPFSAILSTGGILRKWAVCMGGSLACPPVMGYKLSASRGGRNRADDSAGGERRRPLGTLPAVNFLQLRRPTMSKPELLRQPRRSIAEEPK